MMSRTAIEDKLFDQLTSVREIKGQQIENYVGTISRQISTMSDNPAIVDAMSTLKSAFHRVSDYEQRTASPEADSHPKLLSYYRDEFFDRLRPNTVNKLQGVPLSRFFPTEPGSIKFQEKYISDNPNPTGMKHKLDSADNSLYGGLHKKYHPALRNYLEKFGFYDIFLIDNETGHIVYSVFKEVDFATSLLTGPYRETNFARAFKAASQADDKDFVYLVDFEPYYPSYNAAASFIASPIFNGSQKVGVLVFQMPIDRINDIMTSNQDWKNVGLGESGETYIVGDDFTMRNQSRFLIEDPENYFAAIRQSGMAPEIADLIENFGTSIGLQPVKTEGTVAALGGGSGESTFPDYRGVSVLSSFRPLDLQDVNWAIMSEIDEAEAFAPVEKLKDRFILGGSILVAIAVYVAFFFSRSMTASLQTLLTRADALARGELDEPIEIESSDEIGKLAQGFESMRRSIRKLIADLQDEKNALEGRVSERTEELDKAFHKQEEQTQALEQRNAEMLEIQEHLQKSEKEQIANKERVDSILQASPDGICVIDTESTIQMANQSMLQMFGYSQDEIMGQDVKMLMMDEIAHEHDHYIERVVWGREPKLIGKGSREVEGRRKDGTTFPMDLSVAMIGSGKEALFVGILRDITERIAMQEKAKEQAAFQAALLDAVPNPIFVKDVNQIFTAMNRAYEEAFGIRREDYIGTSTLDADYVPEEVREEWSRSDQKLIDKGGYTREELTARFADNREHDVLSMRRTFELGSDATGGMLGILIDISDSKELEREMEVARELAESANETKSAFLANMSHELRTPMNAIIGYAEMLKEDAEDDENEEIIPDLDHIITAGRHLLQLINDVLDISKIEAGRMELYLEDFDIATMISDAASTVTTLVEKNNNVLDIQVEENLGSMHADLTKVRQIVFNLVSNAAKFTSDGKVGIEASAVEIGGQSCIRLAVTDTGIGIPEEKLEHIFEEFSQADNSTTRNYGGTGLGLALVRKFARMMGGDIRVESTTGEGSTFILEVPAKVVETGDSTSVLKTIDAAIETSASLGKILVIDDDPIARQLLTRVLEDQGYQVITAENGEHGVALAKSEKPALITCDILMPNVDGWEVLQLLKDDPDTASIPVVMVSMVDDGKKGAALGAVEHLRKPVDRERLRKIVARYVKTAGKVMVVEDDPATQKTITKALGSMSIEALPANNGREALDILAEQWPDLILLDLMMPVMDGYEFLSHFRKLEGSQETPVIVVTAKDLSIKEREELAGCVSGILTKEENYVEDLIESIGALVGKSEQSDN
jgi:PAS domain S-box-containing protein